MEVTTEKSGPHGARLGDGLCMERRFFSRYQNDNLRVSTHSYLVISTKKFLRVCLRLLRASVLHFIH